VNDAMISSIVSAVVGAIVGGMISLLVSMQRSRADAQIEQQKADAEIRNWREKYETERTEKISEGRRLALMEAIPLLAKILAPIDYYYNFNYYDRAEPIHPEELRRRWDEQGKRLYLQLANLGIVDGGVLKADQLVRTYLDTIQKSSMDEVELKELEDLRLKTRDQLVALMAPRALAVGAAVNHAAHAD
jgi:hypothetical protein